MTLFGVVKVWVVISVVINLLTQMKHSTLWLRKASSHWFPTLEVQKHGNQFTSSVEVALDLHLGKLNQEELDALLVQET
jgi:hypothetical protein